MSRLRCPPPRRATIGGGDPNFHNHVHATLASSSVTHSKLGNKLNCGRRVTNKPLAVRFAKTTNAEKLHIATKHVVTQPSGSGRLKISDFKATPYRSRGPRWIGYQARNPQGSNAEEASEQRLLNITVKASDQGLTPNNFVDGGLVIRPERARQVLPPTRTREHIPFNPGTSDHIRFNPGKSERVRFTPGLLTIRRHPKQQPPIRFHSNS